MNHRQGGFSFDSGGAISMHDGKNTNGYRLHGFLDLNGHGIDEVLSFGHGDKIVLHKTLDLNGKDWLIRALHYLSTETGSSAF